MAVHIVPLTIIMLEKVRKGLMHTNMTPVKKLVLP